MLTREEIEQWNAPATYTVTGDGLTVQRGGEVVLTIPPDRFPDLMVRLATVLRYSSAAALR